MMKIEICVCSNDDHSDSDVSMCRFPESKEASIPIRVSSDLDPSADRSCRCMVERSGAPPDRISPSNQKDGAVGELLVYLETLCSVIGDPNGSSKSSCNATLATLFPFDWVNSGIQGSTSAHTSHQTAVYCSARTV